MTTKSFPCSGCKHLIRAQYRCTAFPNGIPDEIIDAQYDHRDPYPGDQGIRFEPADEYASDDYALLFENKKTIEKAVA